MQNGWTPLYIAAERNYPDIIRILMENGAQIDVQDQVFFSENILYSHPMQSIEM